MKMANIGKMRVLNEFDGVLNGFVCLFCCFTSQVPWSWRVGQFNQPHFFMSKLLLFLIAGYIK